MLQEWQGQTSSKFKGSKKIIGPYSTALNEVPGLLGETSIGIDRLKGKRHFETTECQTFKDWRPCFKKSEKFVNDQKTLGVKRIDADHQKPKPRAEKKHIESLARSDETEYQIHMKTVFKDTGKRIQDAQTTEYDFHVTHLGRKIRVEGLEAQRNGLEVRSLGDKHYKIPEQSTGFYKEGGLIPGSTVANRIPHQGKSAANNDFATVISYDATNPARTKWKDREKLIKMQEDDDAIKQLIEWEKTILKETNPKYVDPDLSDGD